MLTVSLTLNLSQTLDKPAINPHCLASINAAGKLLALGKSGLVMVTFTDQDKNIFVTAYDFDCKKVVLSLKQRDVELIDYYTSQLSPINPEVSLLDLGMSIEILKPDLYQVNFENSFSVNVILSKRQLLELIQLMKTAMQIE